MTVWRESYGLSNSRPFRDAREHKPKSAGQREASTIIHLLLHCMRRAYRSVFDRLRVLGLSIKTSTSFDNGGMIMTTIKRLTLTSVCLGMMLTVCAGISAQDNGGPPKHHGFSAA